MRGKRKVWVPTERDVLREVERGIYGQAEYIAKCFSQHKILFSPISANAMLSMAVALMLAFGDTKATILIRAKREIRRARKGVTLKLDPHSPKTIH